MSFIGEQDISLAPPAPVSTAGAGDYVALLKPRVMSLVVFTALAGMLIAPGHMNPVVGFAALLSIAIGAGAAGALNMWYDADIDALMTRTRRRPVPAGIIRREEALAFGVALAILAVFTLGIVANWQAGAMLAFTIFFYVVVYTMWLKRSTPQNIVIGGAAGAFPPIVGYLAVTGLISIDAIVLFAIIFMWTPPHFWALALVKSEEYAKAGIPMMPNVRGAAHTRLEILIYSVLLAPIGMLPYLMGFASPVYGVVALLGGAAMVLLSLRVYRLRSGPAADRVARQLFGFSILYLFLLFAVVVAERVSVIGAQMIG